MEVLLIESDTDRNRVGTEMDSEEASLIRRDIGL